MNSRSLLSWALPAMLALQFFAVVCSINVVHAEPDPTTLLMTINGQGVRQGDMNALAQIKFGPKFMALTPEQRATVQINQASDTRGQMIDRVLLVTAAKADGVVASGAEVDAQLDQVKTQLPAGMTLAGYVKGIGVSMSQFRQYAVEQVLINKLSEKRTARIPLPTAKEIETYYRQNPDYFAQKERAQVSHVLVSTINTLSDEQRAEKRALAEVVRRRLLAEGPDAFASIAREVSNCPSKEQGGDLGTIERGKMVAAFDEAAFSQKIGAIGRVIRTPKGYHVLKVDERIPANQITLQEASADIAALLLFNARNQAMEGYLATLRLSAKVVVPKSKPSGTSRK